jgi:hypothetical protein
MRPRLNYLVVEEYLPECAFLAEGRLQSGRSEGGQVRTGNLASTLWK